MTIPRLYFSLVAIPASNYRKNIAKYEDDWYDKLIRSQLLLFSAYILHMH